MEASVEQLPQSYEDVQRIKYELWGVGNQQEVFTEAAALRVVAEGDSWFDYPPGLDILDHLKRDYGYEIDKNSYAGDTIENMAYGTEIRPNFSRRTPQLTKTLAAVSALRPRVFLLSGGGNDIAGPELESFLNHKDSGLPLLREEYVDYAIFSVFKSAYRYIMEQVWAIDPAIHIFAHGYAHAIPDGRAVVNLPLSFHFVGPWLRPALAKKNITNPVEAERTVRTLIDRFNDMLSELDGEHERFHHIDLRNEVRREDWVNELHVSNGAYRRVARLFHQHIENIAS